MKINHILLVLTILASTFFSCDDGDKTYFDPSASQTGQLDSLTATNYVLDAAKEKEIVETFRWSLFDFGYQAVPKYILQMDIAGNEFANAVDLGNTTNRSLDITYKAMNNAIMDLYEKYNIEHNTTKLFDFRLKITVSTNPNNQSVLYSNIRSANLTPYNGEANYPKVTVIGGYSGWDWSASQSLFDFNKDQNYQGWIYFNGKAADGFKLAIPKIGNTGELEWDDAANWGLSDGQNVQAEADVINLISSGNSGNVGNIYSNNYYFFKFDLSNSALTKVQSIQTLGIVGDAANGWDEKPDNDIPFRFDTDKQTFVVTTTLKNGEIKFRADNKWGGIEYGGTNGKLEQGGTNIKIEAGKYKITLNLNDPDNMTYKLESVKTEN